MMPGQRSKQRWVAALAELDPDLVVDTGDNLAHPRCRPRGAARARPAARPARALFVFGSNDYCGPTFKNPARYLLRRAEARPGRRAAVARPARRLRRTPAGLDLNNARHTLKAGGRTVELVGVDDPHIDRDDYAAWPARARLAADLRLGLTHSPEPRVLDAMAADGFGLLLAGHTHGGQVCVPRLRGARHQLRLDPARGPRACTGGGRGHLAARLRRSGHPPDRPGPLRLPAGGDHAHAGPPLTTGPGRRRLPACRAWRTSARLQHASGCGAAW